MRYYITVMIKVLNNVIVLDTILKRDEALTCLISQRICSFVIIIVMRNYIDNIVAVVCSEYLACRRSTGARYTTGM